jgi:hypothetical protein
VSEGQGLPEPASKPPAGVRCEMHGGAKDGLVLRFPSAPDLIRVPLGGDKTTESPIVEVFLRLQGASEERRCYDYRLSHRERLRDRPAGKR